MQVDMFSGELVDNRTRKQKKQDKEYALPQQGFLFSQREMAEFGVEAHPKIPLSPHTRLALVMQDGRSPQEKERQLRQQIEAATHAMPWAHDESSEENEAVA